MPEVAQTYLRLVSLFQLGGEHEKALEALRIALLIQTDLLGPTHDDVIKMRMDLTRLLVAAERKPEGITNQQETVSLLLEKFGPGHARVQEAEAVLNAIS